MKNLIENLDNILNSTTSIKLHTDKVSEILASLDDSIPDDLKLKINSKIKSKVQIEAMRAFYSAGGFGAIYAATGTGKSKIGVVLASSIASRKQNAKILIVVPTEKLRDENWKEEFEKWDALGIWNSFVRRECYASLNKIEGEEYDLVILDEGHNITRNNSVFFEKNTVHSCVLLTATEPEDFHKKEILKQLKLNKVYDINLDESVKLGLVAPYEITVLTIKLNDRDKYVKSGNKNKVFYQTEKAKYEYLSQLCEEQKTKINLLNRMRFIYNLRSKTNAAKWFLENVVPKELRTLIFCGSIEQAIEVNDRRFFSKPSAKKTDPEEKRDRVQRILEVYEGDAAYNDFRNLVINRMSCVNSLNEGHNIPMLDIAFILQMNGNELDFIQRMGRLIRFRPGHRGKMFILCTEDSVDKEWTLRATSNINQANIRWVSLSDVHSGKETILFN